MKEKTKRDLTSERRYTIEECAEINNSTKNCIRRKEKLCVFFDSSIEDPKCSYYENVIIPIVANRKEGTKRKHGR